MTNAARDRGNLCAVYVDMGTTNTRVWITCRDRIVANSSGLIGIRDAARDDGRGIRRGLGELITKMCQEAERSADPCRPECIVAAGMISSNLGFAVVPHIQPPAGIDELAVAARWHHFPEVSNLPMLLVPGVRSGPANATTASINQVDVMRGEETLCSGLAALGMIKPPAIVLNLGSHWKAVQLDRDGRIQSSFTSLSGELIHAVQSHTVLAGSVPKERPARLPSEWVKAGMREQRQSGLARALFCTRLLDLEHRGNPEDRFAFVVGAFIASDLDVLLARGILTPPARVALVGHFAISEAWQIALSQLQVAAALISQEQAEAALLEALRRILIEALPSFESTSQRAHANE